MADTTAPDSSTEAVTSVNQCTARYSRVNTTTSDSTTAAATDSTARARLTGPKKPIRTTTTTQP